MGKLGLLAILFCLTACSTLEKARDRYFSGGKREFHVSKLWARQTLEEDNLKFRKINRFQPLAYKNLLIQGNAIDGLVAFDRDSGRLVWRKTIPLGVESSGTLINDRLFVGGNDGQYYSLDADDGTVVWTFPIRIEALSQPLLDNGVLYFLTGNNSLYAIDASTGKQLWQYSRQDTTQLTVRGGSRPVLKNGTLFVGFSDGAFVAVLASNGAIKWEKQLSKNKKFRDIDSDPVIDGDFIYIGGFDDQTYALRTATGDIVWSAKAGVYGQILMNGDHLYVASTDSKVHKLKKDSGDTVWTYSLKEGVASLGGFLPGILVLGGSSDHLYFVDVQSGRLINKYTPGRGIFSSPLVDEKRGQVAFISGEGNLYLMSAQWSLQKHVHYLR
ncbi:MAG: PQQ-binding-like beta-propeller repeat protein [Proteobacteria bacterium]|nr:PQQ-binding-like beta-propeller repeat protein [Pseudomonadota bacterium]